jgi:hypothetical protein
VLHLQAPCLTVVHLDPFVTLRLSLQYWESQQQLSLLSLLLCSLPLSLTACLEEPAGAIQHGVSRLYASYVD